MLQGGRRWHGDEPCSQPWKTLLAALKQRLASARRRRAQGRATGSPSGVTGGPGGLHQPEGMQSLVFAPPPIICGDRHAPHKDSCAAVVGQC